MTAPSYRLSRRFSRQNAQNWWGRAENRRKSRQIAIILAIFAVLFALDMISGTFRAIVNLFGVCLAVIALCALVAYSRHLTGRWVRAHPYLPPAERTAERRRRRRAIEWANRQEAIRLREARNRQRDEAAGQPPVHLARQREDEGHDGDQNRDDRANADGWKADVHRALLVYRREREAGERADE